MSLQLKELRNEYLYFLRNSDIFTITERNVTTVQINGTFTAESEIIIGVSNIKNVRTVEVDSTVLDYGADYTVDTDFDDSGTIKCKITFTSPQTGDYEIIYDHGTDKIFSDFPRSDLSIDSFPRIGFDVIYTTTDPGGLGTVDVSVIGITTVAYGKTIDDLRDYIDNIRDAVRANKGSFYYMGGFTQVIATGPIIKSDDSYAKDKIFQQNIDVEGRLKYER